MSGVTNGRRKRRLPAADPALAVETPTRSGEAARESTGVSVSLEALIWLLLIGLATALRLARLDHLPLTIDESARSLAAWQTSQGNTPDNWLGDLTSSLTAYLFSIFGADDFAARLVPALAGAALVALLWPLSRYVGGAALGAAGFITFSPLLVHVSRSSLPYSVGTLLSLVMVLAFFAYLRDRRPFFLFLFILGLGLALGSDPISTSTAIILVAFLVYEAAWRRNEQMLDALGFIRQNPPLLISSVLFLLGALELGVTHFGTSIDRLSLPGLRQWVDMFELPRDGLPWHFQPGILIGYEAPLLLLGGAAYLWLLYRWLASRGEEISLFQGFLLFWASAAAIIVAITSRHEASQLIILLLPLALLAGSWLERIAAEADLESFGQAAPYLVPVLLLAAYLALILSNWAQAGEVGPGDEKAALVLATGGGILLIWVAWNALGQRAAAGSMALALILAIAFLVHGATSVAYGRGSEFLADERLDRQVFQLQRALATIETQTPGRIAVDASFLPTLGWYLRDVRGVVFAPSPPADAVAILKPAGEAVPPGYRPTERTWPVAKGWIPSSIDPLAWWRWLVYRKPYGNLSSIEADLLVRGE